MSADWDKPTSASNYSTEFIQELDARLDDILLGFDPAVVTPTNFPANAIRWTSASNKWQLWNGSTWGDLSSLYAINISGNAGTATIWATGRTVSLAGDATGTSGSLDGSGNVSITATLATVTAAKGGTGQASYTIGDVLYASSSSALSKLADIATGNALISGGVGAAPAWGKIALTTHISGTLAVANGGTGVTTSTGTGNTVLSSGAVLVGPALGTPASGNLANCTGYVETIVAATTPMLFYKATPPTGWTAVAINEHAIRVVTTATTGGSTGGSVNFSTHFASQASGATAPGSTDSFTLTSAEMPAHTHVQQLYLGGVLAAYNVTGSTGNYGYGAAATSSGTPISTQSSGSGAGHTHTHAATHTHAWGSAIKFADVIVATKD